jgi:hypothetical protein
MATMILLPNGSNNESSDWVIVGAASFADALDSDDGITSYVKCNDVNESFQIEFANPLVAEADIDTIDSVRFLSSGKSAHRTNTTRCSFLYYVPSGNGAENAIYNAHRTDFTTAKGTARSHANGTSGGWTYANLEDLELRVTMASIVEVYLSYLALEVTYTEVGAVGADNATFFGANF